MTMREVIHSVYEGKKPPYVPWNLGFTHEAYQRLSACYGGPAKTEAALQNHFIDLGNANGYITDMGNGRVRDYFGVIWNRSVDKDIGIVEGTILDKPSINGYKLPDPRNPAFTREIPARIREMPERFRLFSIGFSLFERAWTLRGMENLLVDFYEHPEFARELLHVIADYNIALVHEAMKYEIDAIHFGDDWGQQHGLIMGPEIWREFIYPELKRMYAAVKEHGAYVSIHSCGDVDELFDDLVGIGLDCFNPFQPEVMDTFNLIETYRGRLAFHGGLSTQKVLPAGSVADVVRETEKLLAAGREGGYIFAPAHAVEGDVPLENMVAFIETIQNRKTI